VLATSAHLSDAEFSAPVSELVTMKIRFHAIEDDPALWAPASNRTTGRLTRDD
jgi:hypothetical protein